jgi:hypothetical protein
MFLCTERHSCMDTHFLRKDPKGCNPFHTFPHYTDIYRILRKDMIRTIKLKLNIEVGCQFSPIVLTHVPNPPHEIFSVRHSSISISQKLPVKPVPAHSHLKSAIRSVQVPLFWHGIEAHSSMFTSQYFPEYPN